MKKPSFERHVVADIEDLGSRQQMCGGCSPSGMLECENVSTLKKVKKRIPEIWPLSSKKKRSYLPLALFLGAAAIITAIALPILKTKFL